MNQSVKNKKASRDLKAEAAKIVKAINLQGESRAETQRLVAGVQRAMEHHLRQHNAKARELDKKAKKLKQMDVAQNLGHNAVPTSRPDAHKAWLPWLLLALSWLLFAGYFVYGLAFR